MCNDLVAAYGQRCICRAKAQFPTFVSIEKNVNLQSSSVELHWYHMMDRLRVSVGADDSPAESGSRAKQSKASPS